MLRKLEIPWPNDFEIITSIKGLIEQNIIGVCINGRGLIHKISTLDAPENIRQWAEQKAIDASIHRWGNKIFKRGKLLSEVYETSKKFGILKIIIMNPEAQNKPEEYIVVLVFIKERFQADKLFQLFIEKYQEIKAIENSIIAKFHFQTTFRSE